MILFALVSAAIIASTPAAPAAPAAPQTVRVHTSEASYVRTVAADGAIILHGQYMNTGQRFRFTVKNDVVRGWVGGKPVSFPLSKMPALLR